MASIYSEDENENFDDNLSISSEKSSFSIQSCSCTSEPRRSSSFAPQPCNLLKNLVNREINGSFGRVPKRKTEKLLPSVHQRCIFPLSSIINVDTVFHIYMGFTLCGQYFLSYTEQHTGPFYELNYEYELFIWKFHPGEKLQFVSKHKIFNHPGIRVPFTRVMFMQFPNDMHKIVCYGNNEVNCPESFYITILTLPSNNCVHCYGLLNSSGENIDIERGWCLQHGFIVHYVFLTNLSTPNFDPKISLSYPNHLVINTGHHIHILNISTAEPMEQNHLITQDLIKNDELLLKSSSASSQHFNDNFSEVSETDFGCRSVVDGILDDFSEYDLDSNEGNNNKPFHELNISCEPLNITGKSYHNTLVQNIFDTRLKRSLANPTNTPNKDCVFSVPHCSSQHKPPEKIVDKKIAEKAYEFIEENDKYEKISLFRKKRLADKKYEFSEDNSENIVPFHILRRERRFLYTKPNSRQIRSAEFNSLFLSPRSPGWRSPMQSPNSRNGQFSPSGARHIYCTSVRNSPYHSKSPISPSRDYARKVSVYSPSLESDCSDSESRLILNKGNVNFFNNDKPGGLLIVDPKVDAFKWIKKVVRRFSNEDFENSSLLSGQSRDDYNTPIEVPLLVQSLTDQQFDFVPENNNYKIEHLRERQILVSQRSMDCEQFFQRQAQVICLNFNLQFMFCEDYDIKIQCVCSLNGEILCQAVIKIGALKSMEPNSIVEHYWTYFWFTWNISSDAFDIIESDKLFKLNYKNSKLFPTKEQLETTIPKLNYPKFSCQDVWILLYDTSKPSKFLIRDRQENHEIRISSDTTFFTHLNSDEEDYLFAD